MKAKIKHPKKLPSNQWDGFYIPKAFDLSPTKRFPNRAKTKCGKTFFFDQKNKPYTYIFENGKISMKHLPAKNWWAEPVSVPSAKVSKGLNPVTVPKR